MTLPEVNTLFSTDEKCRELLERLRWPEGVTCPRCKDRRVSRMKDYARFECVGCEYQFTLMPPPSRLAVLPNIRQFLINGVLEPAI